MKKVAEGFAAFSMMVVVASGIVAAAAIGIFGLLWFAIYPFIKFLL